MFQQAEGIRPLWWRQNEIGLWQAAASVSSALLEGVMGCATSALCQPTWHLRSSEHTHAVQIHAPGHVWWFKKTAGN